MSSSPTIFRPTECYAQFATLVPAFIQEAMGGVLVGTFAGAIALGFAHPLVMLSLSCGAIYLASEPAGEVEDGLVDLDRRAARSTISDRYTVCVCVRASAALQSLPRCSRPAASSCDGCRQPPPWRCQRYGSRWVAANLLAIVWCFGAAVARGGLARRQRTRAAGTVALVAVSLYLLQFGAAAWTPLRPLARVSPFHYYEPMQTLLGRRQPVTYLLGLLTATMALLGVAYTLYSRRDL